jgi:hypothetical protein
MSPIMRYCSTHGLYEPGNPSIPRGKCPACYQIDSSRRNRKARANGTKSAGWSKLRQQRIQLDGGLCTFQLPGCTGAAKTVHLPPSSRATTTWPRWTTPGPLAGIVMASWTRPDRNLAPASGANERTGRAAGRSGARGQLVTFGTSLIGGGQARSAFRMTLPPLPARRTALTEKSRGCEPLRADPQALFSMRRVPAVRGFPSKSAEHPVSPGFVVPRVSG